MCAAGRIHPLHVCSVLLWHIKCLAPDTVHEHRFARSRADDSTLQVAFKFADAAKALEKSQDATISGLLRTLPFEMMCDIVNVTPALEVDACTTVLQQAMADIRSVENAACIQAFSQACTALQARPSSTSMNAET